MKYTNLRAFEKHLEGSVPDHFANVYLVISKEEYDRKRAVELFVAKQSDIKSFEGESLEISAVLQELNTLPFFSSKIIVVISNCDKMKKAAITQLENYIVQPNRKAFLFMTASSYSTQTNFYKKIEKAGVIVDITAEKAWEKEKFAAEWIGSTVTAGGRKIAFSLCEHIVKQLGTDKSVLHQELEKLFCYLGERKEITAEDVSAVCSTANVENVWQLGEAIFKRDSATALRACKALLSDGSAFLGLLKQLRSQFQTEYQVCTILNNGGTPHDVSAQFPYMKGFILERHCQMARGYGLERFRKALITIDDTETQAKNSSGDPDLLAELLMVRLTT